MDSGLRKRSRKWAYGLTVAGVVITVAMAVAVVYFWEYVRRVEGYGYLGVSLISILGGATIIVPVPMLAVVFAMGGVLKPYWVGVSAGLGETLGALIVYMTGHGAGMAFFSTNGRLSRVYLRLMRLMEQHGSITLFLLSAILNPFFYPAALAAGAMRFGIKKYFYITLVGKTIKGLTVAYAGFWGLRSLLRLLGMPV